MQANRHRCALGAGRPALRRSSGGAGLPGPGTADARIAQKNVRDDGNRFRAVPGARRLRDAVTFHWEMLPAGADTVLAKGVELLLVDDDDRIRRLSVHPGLAGQCPFAV